MYLHIIWYTSPLTTCRHSVPHQLPTLQSGWQWLFLNSWHHLSETIIAPAALNNKHNFPIFTSSNCISTPLLPLRMAASWLKGGYLINHQWYQEWNNLSDSSSIRGSICPSQLVIKYKLEALVLTTSCWQSERYVLPSKMKLIASICSFFKVSSFFFKSLYQMLRSSGTHSEPRKAATTRV